MSFTKPPETCIDIGECSPAKWTEFLELVEQRGERRIRLELGLELEPEPVEVGPVEAKLARLRSLWTGAE